MIKYYLAAFDPDDKSDTGYGPIGGLSDVFGWSETPDDLINYVDESSFHFAGQIFFIKDDQIYVYAHTHDSEMKWHIFDEPVKLEEYHKIMRLG